MADALSADRVVPLLRGRLGHEYRYFESCVSTQLDLGPEDPEGAVAVADHQEAGRGRLGRAWLAPAGSSLLLSVLLRPAAPHPLPQLSLVAGLAIARTIEAESDLKAQIKWPNDVLVDDRKLAGALAEGRGASVVLGIGLNVNQTPEELPDGALGPAASLRSLDGRARDRTLTLVELLLQIERAYDAWQQAGLHTLHGELADRDWLLGRSLEAGGVAGTGAGIAADGSLLVDTGGTVRRVASGEVTIRLPRS
jgi:BirA family biotin operon repressor/biotin-[acetyl-CoA-carboxylase] ligase